MNSGRFATPNPPLHRASTVLFDSVEALDEVNRRFGHGDPGASPYGTMGTPTTAALADLIREREGGAGVAFAPCGLGAVTLALLSSVRQGSHLLLPDNVYGPTREFCATWLTRFGVETELYPAGLGSSVAQLVRAATDVLFIESPGSFTFEVEDVPAMVSAARSVQPGICIIADNAWGSPGLFSPLTHGVDISVVPLTKYWGGHADLLAGAVVANTTSWSAVRRTAFTLGVHTNADEASLVLRGARTVDIRLRQHAAAALEIAEWLTTQPQVGRVLHPALPSSPGHALWRRDFSGSNGLLSFELRGAGDAPASLDEVARFVNRLLGDGLFRLGYSWGGYESLVMPAVLPGGPNIVRTAAPVEVKSLVRLHIGLEPVGGLRASLGRALAG
jgi:cysteine-S-conjugate beta-lyase